MQNNLFFLCGPQGSGKTTFVKMLEKADSRILVPELYSRNVKFDVAPRDRLLLKVCGRSIENFEYLQIAENNPDRIVLGNRCIYDQLTYNKVYQMRGWISERDLWLSNTLAENFYIERMRNPYAIVLNPGFEVVRNHLEKRWAEKGKKWREDDEQYIRLACDLYEDFRDKENVKYIDHEIDLNSEVDIKDSIGWMDGLKYEERVYV